MLKSVAQTVLFLLLLCECVYGQTYTLENDVARLKFARQGGKISEFNYTPLDINPIHSRYRHFICFDRWGPSSEEDQNLGIPFHGEASSRWWSLVTAPVEQEDFHFMEMSVQLPIVKLAMNRRVWLSKDQAVYKIVEQISNQDTTAKIYNHVQHVTIGPPFLDETTIVDSRLTHGFEQYYPEAQTEIDSLTWPNVVLDGDSLDLRFHKTDVGPDHVVFSYLLDKEQEYAWVTASNSAQGLLLGYIWPLSEYPWLNLWMHRLQGGLDARGLEFGTSGLHQPFPVIEEMESIFDQSLFETIAVDETITKTYFGFMAEIPTDYKGVEDVTFDDNRIRVIEYDADPARDIVLDVDILVTDVGTRQNLNNSPETFVLAQNYPNPFNQSTIINYQLPQASDVELTVYSITGQKMATLVSERKPAGNHRYEWNAGDFASGVYFYRLTAGDFVQVQKLVLIK